MMSSTMASGANSRADCSASKPEPAVRTSQPSIRSAIDSRSVSICSSSTTSTRRVEPSGRRRAGAGLVMRPLCASSYALPMERAMRWL